MSYNKIAVVAVVLLFVLAYGSAQKTNGTVNDVNNGGTVGQQDGRPNVRPIDANNGGTVGQQNSRPNDANNGGIAGQQRPNRRPLRRYPVFRRRPSPTTQNQNPQTGGTPNANPTVVVNRKKRSPFFGHGGYYGGYRGGYGGGYGGYRGGYGGYGGYGCYGYYG